MVIRELQLIDFIGQKKSTFLFGPRGVGKSTLVREFLKEQSQTFEINLLKYSLFMRYTKNPDLLISEVKNKLTSERILTVFIDEVQKIPHILDHVHLLLEEEKPNVRFILSGSSARKLKRGGANLLAGRALTLSLHPLIHTEIKFNLDKALQWGTLPAIYLEDPDPTPTLESYVETYLKEEIQEEALVRKVDAFIRFLDIAGQMNGEPTNFLEISRDCHVSSNTVQEYYSILTDTLIAYRLNGWSFSVRKQVLASPKFYFFDCGVLNAIRGELSIELKEGSYRYGKLFETFIIQEMFRFNDYTRSHYEFLYWRTNTGMEVDLILTDKNKRTLFAIEIKASAAPQKKYLKGLESFKSENHHAQLFCICQTEHSYKLDDITVLPWKEAFKTFFHTTHHASGE